jgi:hypothetical protein
MNAQFTRPDLYMGEDATTTTTTTPTSTGPSTNTANIISSITSGLASIATSAFNAFGTQPTTPTTTTPGGTPIVVTAPAAPAKSFDPMLGLAIGIPTALVLIALVGRKK